MRSLALSLLLLVIVPAAAVAQGRSQGVAASRLADLSFGTVISGLPATVLPTDPTAGEFSVSAPNKALVMLTFQLPPALTGPSPMPVTFGPGSAAWSLTNIPTGATFFNPQNGVQVQLPPGSRTIYVWLGGSLGTIASSQPSGNYTATLTVSAVAN